MHRHLNWEHCLSIHITNRLIQDQRPIRHRGNPASSTLTYYLSNPPIKTTPYIQSKFPPLSITHQKKKESLHLPRTLTFSPNPLLPGALGRPHELEARVEEQPVEILVRRHPVDVERQLDRPAGGHVGQGQQGRRVVAETSPGQPHVLPGRLEDRQPGLAAARLPDATGPAAVRIGLAAAGRRVAEADVVQGQLDALAGGRLDAVATVQEPSPAPAEEPDVPGRGYGAGAHATPDARAGHRVAPLLAALERRDELVAGLWMAEE